LHGVSKVKGQQTIKLKGLWTVVWIVIRFDVRLEAYK
jgi:hypothetical protein